MPYSYQKLFHVPLVLIPVRMRGVPPPCRADDLFHICELRLPAEHRTRLLARRDELRRIARTARADLHRDCLACRFFRRGDHLLHREAAAAPEVKNVALPAAPQIVKRTHMRIREINDVNVVAQTGSVRRRIVVAVSFVSP